MKICSKDFAVFQPIKVGLWPESRVVATLSQEGVWDRIVLPVHGNKPLKIGLLKSQMKVALKAPKRSGL